MLDEQRPKPQEFNMMFVLTCVKLSLAFSPIARASSCTFPKYCDKALGGSSYHRFCFDWGLLPGRHSAFFSCQFPTSKQALQEALRTD